MKTATRHHAGLAKADKYFLYARKSTDDTTRQIRSIEDQIAEVEELAKREGLEIVDRITEKQSAKTPGRPAFNTMLARIEKGEASGILAWHPDRLSRNSLDAGRIVYLVDTGHIKDLRFPTFRFESSAQGKFMLNVMFGQSKYYVDNLSENILRGMRQKIRHGGWPQLAPMGYINDRKSRSILPHPEYAPLVKKVFELYATGEYSMAQLHRMLLANGYVNQRGHRPVMSFVSKVLQNPFYYGVMRYNGELYEGTHEPLISQETFKRCQAVQARRGKNLSFDNKNFLFQGMIRCGECGCAITSEVQKGHRYLRCTKKKGPCAQKYSREETIIHQVEEGLRGCSTPPAIAAALLECVQIERGRQAEEASAVAAKLKAEISACEVRRDRLMTAYVEQVLSLEEFRESKNRLTEEIRAKRDRLGAAATGGASWLEPFEDFLRASQEATYVADQGDAAAKARFFQKVGSNLTLRDRRLKWDLRGAWQLVEDQAFASLKRTGLLPKGSGHEARATEDLIKWRQGDSNP